MARKSIDSDETVSPDDFEAIKLSVASPEDILEWSYGEVLNSETINYRTQRPERDGLFDEKIFGPIKDFECYCGKYKGIRYKGVKCDKCGVEVVSSKVRRRRMGHIKLAVPCSHTWFVRGVSSMMANILGITAGDLGKVLYFGAFIVTGVDEKLIKDTLTQLDREFQQYKARLIGKGGPEKKGKKKSKTAEIKNKSKDMENLLQAYDVAKKELKELKPLTVISEFKYHDISRKYGQIIEVGIGAESIKELLLGINLEEELDEVKKERKKYLDDNEPRKLMIRASLLQNLQKNKIRPEWMVFDCLPVLPPDLRPMVQLDGGRFAASDLNDLYRRVINRNNRLKRLIEKGAPEVIQRNEKRMLQEAVDSLVENRGGESQIGRRPLRSLSDLIKGKKGRFRRNLLGKRVDYSGRSVIVIGPELKLNQCGLPKMMALELFKPFVINRLIEGGYAHNIKNATRMIDQKEAQVWDMLEEVVKDYPVALNRAPTLHRLGIQSFKPVLVEGKAIRIHPLVCEAYNADFDGDQMAVYIPLTKKSCQEANEILASTNNLVKPATGRSVVNPRQDMVYGLYYATILKKKGLAAGKIFFDANEAVRMHRNKKLGVCSSIKVKIKGKMIETSVGRILFNEILPKDHAFVNKTIDRGEVGKIIDRLIEDRPWSEVVEIIDGLKDLGFYYATHSGLSFSLDDITIPPQKKKIVDEAGKKTDQINHQYQKGLITEEERYSMVIDRWTGVKDRLEELMEKGFKKDNSIFIMVNSGSRGSTAQLSQLAAMKGMVVNPAGQIIELPVKSNYKEGFNSSEYFLASHGTRKGRTDTALRTAEAGYLTRRLIDVSQNLIISNLDCGTAKGIEVNLKEDDKLGRELSQKLMGRVAAQGIKDKNGKIIVKKGTEINQKELDRLKKGPAESIKVFSPLTCEDEKGICQKCYGQDLATHQLVERGVAIGIIAAQSIGEPGTQLTMRTFHIGGVAGEDITQGLPRIQEVLEVRSPSHPAILAGIDGKIKVREDRDNNRQIISVVSDKKKQTSYPLKRGYEVKVEDGQIVKGGDIIIERPKGSAIKADFRATVKLEKGKLTIISSVKVKQDYSVGSFLSLWVKDGQQVTKGEQLTEGHIDLKQLFQSSGREVVQQYILDEVQKIYVSQGQVIHDKHFEVIIREMFSKVRIISSGDSSFVVGDIVNQNTVKVENIQLKKAKKQLIKAENLLLGISKVALNTESFLSAASFQETTRILIQAAISGNVDRLEGLKENVIVGRLIPAGTGFQERRRK